MTRRRIVAYGFAVTLVVALMAASSGSLSSWVDLRIYDTILRSARTSAPAGRVAIVAIDDRSLSSVGQWPWPRDVIATLIDRVTEAGAAVAAVDLLLAEPDRFDRAGAAAEKVGTDESLAAALSRGRVVLGYALTFAAERRDPSACVLHQLDVALVERRVPLREEVFFFQATGATCSLPVFSRAAAGSGFINAGPDRDGLLRRTPLVMAYDGNIYPSLALAAVRKAVGIRHLALSATGDDRAQLTIDGRRVPLDERGTMLIRYRGGRGTFPQLSARDVLEGRAPAGALKGRLVFIGATALGAGDVVATPFDTSMPGIEVHAAAADTLLQGDFVSTPPYTRAYELLATLGSGMTATGLVVTTGYLYGGIFSLFLAALLWWLSSLGVTSAGTFLSPFFPMLSVAATLAALTLTKVRHERRRAESERGRRERAHRFAVHSLTSLIETRDGPTGKHVRRTQHYSRLLASQLALLPRFRTALTPESVDLISRLAPLHDIGKVGVRDAILNKPGPLSPDELAEMHQHPAFGHEAIVKAERLAGAAAEADDAILQIAKDIVYTHHERWDGKGYPRGLKGEEIPIAGRIMAVVDVYDALVDSRTYRSGVTHDEAVSIVRAGRGTHFDPDVVDAFLRVEGEFQRLANEMRAEHSPQS